MEELTADLDPDKFSIVLDHQPQDYEAQAEAGVDLVLGMPTLTLENGEEVGFTDSLLIWPRMTGFTDTKKEAVQTLS